MWMESHGHKANRWEGEELRRRADAIALETGDPLPTLGKQVLFDGKSGERFDQPVTIGIINMLKLAHLVEEQRHTNRLLSFFAFFVGSFVLGAVAYVAYARLY